MYSRRSARIVLLFGLWLALLLCGVWVSLGFEKTPAKVIQSAGAVSSNSLNFSKSKEFQLVVFAHPQCACTKATLSELARFLGRNKNVSGRVYFIVPKAFASWKNSETFKLASRISGVDVRIDNDGQLAKDFKASASGECFLFDRKSTLLFHGGITLARGHEGDNSGLEQLTAIVQRKSELTARNVVYGCSLFDSNGETGN